MYTKCPHCQLIIRQKRKFKSCPNCHSRTFLEAQEHPISLKREDQNGLISELEAKLPKGRKYANMALYTFFLVIPVFVFSIVVARVYKVILSNIYVMKYERIKLTEENEVRIKNLIHESNVMKSKLLISVGLLLIVLIVLFFIFKSQL